MNHRSLIKYYYHLFLFKIEKKTLRYFYVVYIFCMTLDIYCWTECVRNRKCSLTLFHLELRFECNRVNILSYILLASSFNALRWFSFGYICSIPSIFMCVWMFSVITHPLVRKYIRGANNSINMMSHSSTKYKGLSIKNPLSAPTKQSPQPPTPYYSITDRPNLMRTLIYVDLRYMLFNYTPVFDILHIG